MKSIALISAFAAGAAAGAFRDANPFKCPANTPNKCTPKQSGGYDFSDLEPGKPPVGGYNGMDWSGFTCNNGPDKRDRLGRRTGSKFLGGVCGPDKASGPKFGVQKGNPDFEDFSLSEIHVSVEFDCDLEFHYDMPDGSQCKHRSSCSKGIKKVKNEQCGGAKSVTIVYPTQPNKPKPSCSVGVHSMYFDCHTQPPPTHTKPPTTPTYSASSTSSSAPVETTPTTYSPSETPTYYTSEYLSTSTIYTTIVSTVSSCSGNATYCGNGGSVTTKTVILSTTVCPVTETYTPTYTPDTPPPESSTYQGPETSTYQPTETNTYYPTTTSSEGPEETLPCPTVVPQCLNTFLFLVTCADNSDHHCYCPSSVFIESIMTCIYAHGETDTIISQAVIFIQGLCAPYVPVNPGIVTCASVTSYVTPTVTVTVPATYTTATYDVTTVVPCTDEAGNEIPSVYTTTTINTVMTYPQIGLTTGPAGVGFVPVATPQAAVVPAGAETTEAYPTGTGAYTPGKPTGVVTAGAGRNVAGALVAVVVAAVAALV